MCGSCRSRLHRHRQPETFHQAPQEHQNPQRSPVVGTAGRDSQEGMTMPTEKRRIVVSLPARILKDVEWLAPLEDMTRDELILVAIKRFLKPHLDIRKQVLRAAANPGRLSAPFDTAEEVGLSGYEEPSAIESNRDVCELVERIRLAVGPMMNLGDVTSATVPKMCLLAPAQHGGTLR